MQQNKVKNGNRKLLTLEQLAEYLRIKENGARELLIAHPEIKPLIKRHVPYYPIDDLGLKNLLFGISAVAEINPELTPEQVSAHFLTKPFQTSCTYSVGNAPKQNTAHIETAPPDTEEAKKNELLLIKNIGDYVKELEGKYKDKKAFAFQLYYLNIPFDLMVRCNYKTEEYNKQIWPVLKDAKQRIGVILLEKTNKSLPDLDFHLIDRATYSFLDEVFLGKCSDSYEFGKSIVDKLIKQRSDPVINNLREAIDIKLEGIYRSLPLEK